MDLKTIRWLLAGLCGAPTQTSWLVGSAQRAETSSSREGVHSRRKHFIRICVSTQLQQQISSQQSQIGADRQQIARLQGAIKYTVDSDLLFAPGSWEMSQRGKQIIAGFAQKLAPHAAKPSLGLCDFTLCSLRYSCLPTYVKYAGCELRPQCQPLGTAGRVGRQGIRVCAAPYRFVCSSASVARNAFQCSACDFANGSSRTSTRSRVSKNPMPTSRSQCAPTSQRILGTCRSK